MQEIIEGLFGDDAVSLLPQARAELRKWATFYDPKAIRNQVFPVANGYYRLRQVGEFQYIYIDVQGGMYFEFHTSGRPVEFGTVAGSLGEYQAYKVATVGVDVRFAGAVSVAPFIGNNLKQVDASVESVLQRPAQASLIDEPVSYPRAGLAVYESWAPGHPHTGILLRAWNQSLAAKYPPLVPGGDPQTSRGPIGAHIFRDVDFDIPFQYGVGKSKVTRGYIRGDADWPRANAIQVVEHEVFGSRTFGIYNDAFGHFYVFPLSAVGVELPDFAQNITAPRQLTPTFPAWCYVPTERARDAYDTYGGAVAIAMPELDWKFHPDGTKACSIVYERTPAVFDEAYFTTAPSGTPFTTADFEYYRDYRSGVSLRQQVTFPPAVLPQRYNSAPGIVEVSIRIELTGSAADAFEANLSVTEIRRPTTSEYCPLLVGYCGQDVLEEFSETAYQARRGDMVCLDIERYYEAKSVFSGSAFAWTMLVLKNLTRTSELRAFWGSGRDGNFKDWTCRLVDHDLPTLSFALRVEYGSFDERTLQVYPSGTRDEPYSTIHFGISVFVLNRHKEVLYPETIDADARAAIETVKNRSGRDLFPTVPARPYVRLPLNDMRTWADLPGLRDYLAAAFKSGSPATPSGLLLNWFNLGIQPYVQISLAPIFITEPRFSWYAYSDEIANHLWSTLHSTFFAHPSGTWAFFDQSMVYNKQGTDLFNPATDHLADTLTPFDPALLEHCIFDRVHFERGDEAVLDTTFRSLYNAAAEAARASPSPPDLENIELADIRATFEKTVQSSPSVQRLELKTTWFGVSGYYRDGAYTKALSGSPSIDSDAGGLLDHTLGSVYFPEPNSAGTPFLFEDAVRPAKFSSCTLVTP